MLVSYAQKLNVGGASLNEQHGVFDAHFSGSRLAKQSPSCSSGAPRLNSKHSLLRGERPKGPVSIRTKAATAL